MVIITMTNLNVLLTQTIQSTNGNSWDSRLSLVFPRGIDGYYSCKRGKLKKYLSHVWFRL